MTASSSCSLIVLLQFGTGRGPRSSPSTKSPTALSMQAGLSPARAARAARAEAVKPDPDLVVLTPAQVRHPIVLSWSLCYLRIGRDVVPGVFIDAQGRDVLKPGRVSGHGLE